MVTILLVEDEALLAKSILRKLEREGYQGHIAPTLMDARKSLQDTLPDIILLDVNLPDGNGLELLTEIRQHSDQQLKTIPILVLTAFGELDDAVKAMKLGATDYLKKPVDLDELMLTFNRVMEVSKVSKQLDYAQRRDSHSLDTVSMIGESDQMQSLRDQIKRITHLIARSPDNHPVVLIRGETGTGKDVAARMYHESGNWHHKPYVHVDCASLPSELIEAELFGYERGAFTNAHQAKAGLIEVAEGGTLFLDEVGELPLELQAKLLNVLDRRVVRRLGSTKEQPTSAHFVAATNRDLATMVEQGQFRSDLYYRLNILEINLPPLRHRSDDIEILANFFLAKIGRKYGLTQLVLSPDAVMTLMQYHWPGNIRELQHVLERAVMLNHDGVIQANELNLSLVTKVRAQPAGSADDFIGMTLEQVEKQLISTSLERTGGNVSRSARELGLTRMAMRYRMEKYQL